MWYDSSRILSYNKLLNMVVSSRGDGKTYDAKKKVISRFLKDGSTFVYLRRYKTDLLEIGKFFDDIREEFPEEILEVKGKKFYCNNLYMGCAIPLSIAGHFKSVPFAKCWLIIYDEFIIDKKNQRYLPNEVDAFLEMFSTISRHHDKVRALLLANNVSVVNPFFLYWKIKVEPDKRFISCKNPMVIAEFYKDNEYINMMYKTKFGQLVQGTSYGSYAIDNEYLRDNNTFIEPKTPIAEFSIAVKYNGNYYGFWLDYKIGLIYVNNQYDPDSYNIYCITKEDHEPNLLLIKSISTCKAMQRVLYCFQHGLLRFNNMTCKNQFYELIGLFQR